MPSRSPARLLAIVLVLLTSLPAARAWEKRDCERDVKEALDELQKRCGHFFREKGIDWRKVEREFKKEARRVDSPEAHFDLLVRLVARLEDGHAYVKRVGEGESIELPGETEERLVGPGMFWCRVGDDIVVKNAWSSAAELGVTAGCRILTVDGRRVDDWLEERIAERRERMGFSTDHQAFAAACHWGLGAPTGTRLEIEFLDAERKKRKRTITYRRASIVPNGPAFPPAALEGDRDVTWGRTEAGWGYVHLRRCPDDLPTRVDRALAALADAPGLILDLRANGGGGYDHEALMGRFVPAGRSISFGKRYESAGPNPYGGPVVVLVDALTRSAGETTAAIFKEDGRAWLLGEGPTAGMSSSKETIPLPSGLFALYVSVASNMQRSNGGRGIEGIGIPPHEIVTYDPEDLAAGRDTLIRRAEACLQGWPPGKVPYDPKDFGWRR